MFCHRHDIIIHQSGALPTSPLIRKEREWGTRLFERRRANPGKIARILKRVGKGNLPAAGDELPPEFEAKKKRSK
jgi:hypothetical protein